MSLLLLTLGACDGPEEVVADSASPLPDGSPVRDSGGRPDADTAMRDGATPIPGEGIAARYPGDRGIDGDPEVIFADDFEAYADASELNTKWDDVYSNLRMATESENVYGGTQALEFTIPQQNEEMSNTVARRLPEELEAIFLRYYSRYDSSLDIVGSSHNGASISAHYYIDGRATPGVPADGTNKFLISYETWREETSDPSPGYLNLYIYHPEQRSPWGDHFFPSGEVRPDTSTPGNFGDSFIARADVVPVLGRWYCYEVMLRANTPGERDGRITLWLDGAIVADFPNLRLRDVDTLRIDRFSLTMHAASNPAGEARQWYDNVVAATSYIGPLAGGR